MVVMKTDIGLFLRKQRLEKGITMQVVADEVGVHHSLISSYELNKRNPSLRVLKKLAEFYNISYPMLLSMRMDEEENQSNGKDLVTNKILRTTKRHNAVLVKALKDIEKHAAEQKEIKRIIADALYLVESV